MLPFSLSVYVKDDRLLFYLVAMHIYSSIFMPKCNFTLDIRDIYKHYCTKNNFTESLELFITRLSLFIAFYFLMYCEPCYRQGV